MTIDIDDMSAAAMEERLVRQQIARLETRGRRLAGFGNMSLGISVGVNLRGALTAEVPIWLLVLLNIGPWVVFLVLAALETRDVPQLKERQARLEHLLETHQPASTD